MSDLQCSNCLKNIPADKHSTHEAYCARNILKCKQCDDLYDKKQANQHLLLHQIISCSKCEEKFEGRFQSNHKKECKAKTLQCDFCQIPIKNNEWLEHVTQCGSRTQQCQSCKKFIPLRELQIHICKFESQKQNTENNRRKLTRKIQDQMDYQSLNLPSKKAQKPIKNNKVKKGTKKLQKKKNIKNKKKNDDSFIVSSDQSLVEIIQTKQKREMRKRPKRNTYEESKLMEDIDKLDFDQNEDSNLDEFSQNLLQQTLARSKIQF